MNDNWKNIINSGNCPPIDKLILYLKGKLSKEEVYAIENHLADCELCNDALEGISLLSNSDSINNVEVELKERIHDLLSHKKSKKHNLILYRRLAIAASILLLLSISIVIFQYFKRPVTTIVQNIQKEKNKISNEQKKIIAPIATETAPAKPTIKKRSDFKPLKKAQPETKNLYAIVTDTQETSDIVAMQAPAEEYKAVEPSHSVTNEIQLNGLSQNGGSGESYGKVKSREKNLIIEYDKEQLNHKRIISGKVVDATGTALPGVNVVISGTTKGVVTDVEGMFRIETENPEDILQFSYIGYKEEKLAVGKNDTLLIAMNEEVNSLDEVVVVGYGVRKKSMLTSSVSKVERKLLFGRKNKINQPVKKNKNQNSLADQTQIYQSQNNVNTDSVKSLAKKQIELHNKPLALEKLNILLIQASDDTQRKIIEEIINLVREEKFAKALKKIKKYQ
jgi:hypothetical protein